MEKVLNKLGEQLLFLKKEENVDKDNPLIITIKIILNTKSVEIIESLTSDKISIEKFEEILKNNERFIYSEQELKEKKKQDIIQLYDDVLKSEIMFYNINYNIETNILFVTRVIGIGSKYYTNFLGIDMKVPLKTKKYNSDKTSEQKRYEEKVNKFKTFAEQRLRVVSDNIIREIEKKELVPTLKRGKQNYTLTSRFIGNSKILKSFIDTSIVLSIDLNKKDNLNTNKKVIVDVFKEINELVEKYMNYELYK